MTDRTLLLEDTFTFATVPFLVKVEREEMFIHGELEEIRAVDMYNRPAGVRMYKPFNWVKCECFVARVRPDYPYTVEEKWPKNVDKHETVVKPLEVPKKRGWLLRRYESVQERDPEDVDVQAFAELAIHRLKQRYESREKVMSLPDLK